MGKTQAYESKREQLRRVSEEELKKAAQDRRYMFFGFVLTAVQLAATVAFIVVLHRMNILPTDYKVLVDVLLLLFVVITAITQRWRIPGWITKILAFLMTVILIVAASYVQITSRALTNITGTTTKLTTVNVYTLSEHGYDSVNALLEAVPDASFGILAVMDRTNTNEAVAEVEADCGMTLSLTEYETLQELAAGLYTGEVEAVFLNTSYVGLFEDMEGYGDFTEVTSVLTSMEKEEEVADIGDVTIDTTEERELIHCEDGHVFTIYISGMDIEGSPYAYRNSDVNILCVVNRQTKQILLLNTPRDYYVTMAWDGGVMDKLTHAGCHGIECSVNTLQNLYGLQIDDYVKVNFSGFRQVIDSLGGVDVWSTYEFTSYHGNYYFHQGYNTMNGDQALCFCRERYAFGSGDNQRGHNQMEVIKAVILKLQSSELLKNYSSVLNSLSSNMATSMSYEEITELIRTQLEDGTSWDIHMIAVWGSGDNQYCYSLGAANYVMWPNEEALTMADQYLKAIYNDEIIN